MSEKIYNLHWEGPFKWGEHENKLKGCHVLYAIFGYHPTYGSNVLLYIGMTESVSNRMKIHADWIQDEYDVVSVRLASMAEITSWEKWRTDIQYPKANPTEVKPVESLLIYAHQPIYNKSNKDTMMTAQGIRIFNTGKIGSLLPEVSYRYHNESDEW